MAKVILRMPKRAGECPRIPGASACWTAASLPVAQDRARSRWSSCGKIPGFENVVVAGPVGGQNLWSLGHDLVFTDNTLLVPPTENYFAAGSKANMVDIQPCINSGILAGFNAVRSRCWQGTG